MHGLVREGDHLFITPSVKINMGGKVSEKCWETSRTTMNTNLVLCPNHVQHYYEAAKQKYEGKLCRDSKTKRDIQELFL